MQTQSSRWTRTAWCALALGAVSAGGFARAGDEPADKLEAVVERYENARLEFYTALGEADGDEAKYEAALEKEPQAGDFIPEFIAIAKAVPGEEVSAQSWMWVLKIAESDHVDQAKEGLNVLLASHIESKALVDLPETLGYGARKFGDETCEKGLRALMAGSPHDKVQAGATFHMARMVKDKGNLEDAQMLFNELGLRYGDVRDGSGRTYGALAEGNLFEMENLVVGKPAPDIEGEDINGVKFNLSDYRGKVVMLDFWGNW